MATKSELIKALRAEPPARQFVPYCYLSKEADALTVYFEGDPDYSERLSEHITIYRSIETNELVGCRIKGIAGILEDLPNYLRVHHEGLSLSLVFLPFRGSVETEKDRETLNGLAKTAHERGMLLDCAK